MGGLLEGVLTCPFNEFFVDNITHSLFGASVSESLWSLLPQKTKEIAAPHTRRAMLFTSVLANNFPDLDFIYSTRMYSNLRISSLLHHRGHTHTFVIAILESLLILGILAVLQYGFKKWHFKKEWKLLALLSFLGLFTHILLDSINQYGVHPLWPFNNGWLFGDLVFILEPWAWVTFSLFLWSVTERKSLRIFYLSLCALGFLLAFLTGTVPLPMCIFLGLWGVILILVFRFSSTQTKAWLHLLSVSLMLGSFWICRNKIRSLATDELRLGSKNSLIHDIILSPLPINPFCWSLLTVEKENDVLKIQRALAAPFPQILGLKACEHLRFFGIHQKTTASQAHFFWERTEKVSLLELRKLEDEFCDVKEFLKFARAPYFWKEDGKVFVSDLRFERSGKRGFATIEVSSLKPPCPDSKAPWLSPIQPLLN